MRRRRQPWGTRPEVCSRWTAATAKAPWQAEACPTEAEGEAGASLSHVAPCCDQEQRRAERAAGRRAGLVTEVPGPGEGG